MHELPPTTEQEIVPRPRPTSPPVYHSGATKIGELGTRTWRLDDVVDAVFFVVSALLTLWLAWIFLSAGLYLRPRAVACALLFWAVLAYLALPRMHQVLTWLYVPDYFIGRTRTADGLLGDPVNLAVWGSEEAIHESMRAAGWVRADPITLRSSWGIIASSLMRRSYPAAPVSTLTLFGRKQNFAYQKEVEGNPAQRHHIRFWHAPEGWVLPGGKRVDWLAAATYDRAVGLSTLTFQVTHKIDANIDIERNFVVDEVLWANPEAKLYSWADFFTSYHDKNGGGDRVFTDGDLYVLDLSEVVTGKGAAELASSQEADAEADRRRPLALVAALVLMTLRVLLDTGDLVRKALYDRAALAQVELDPQELSQIDPAQAVRLVLAIIVVTVTLLTAILAVAVWRGHPRSRIALMAVLTLGVLADMSEISASGAGQAPVNVLLSCALGVLALLTISTRSCHRWVRERKEERSQLPA
ncbi:LssY C-terminal domain-containing protein [Actinomyces bovis]|nr:LssY C-terminal domain-containing protein [Actinomyces bovis]